METTSTFQNRAARNAIGGGLGWVLAFIVVPLSAIKPSPMRVGSIIGELCSHAFLFGMVIAYAVSRARRLSA